MTNPAASRLLIVVNDAAFFLSHRLPIADAARKAGYEVHIATGPGPAVRDTHLIAGLSKVTPSITAKVKS